MKWIFLILMSASIHQAHATGCGGGWWDETGRRNLPDVEIITNKYGAVRVEVVTNNGVGWVNFPGWGPAPEPLTFYAHSFSLADFPLTELIGEIDARVILSARVLEIEQTLSGYDDCNDVPPGTKQTTTYYTIDIPLPNGKTLPLKASTTVYDPPLEGR